MRFQWTQMHLSRKREICLILFKSEINLIFNAHILYLFQLWILWIKFNENLSGIYKKIKILKKALKRFTFGLGLEIYTIMKRMMTWQLTSSHWHSTMREADKANHLCYIKIWDKLNGEPSKECQDIFCCHC